MEIARFEIAYPLCHPRELPLLFVRYCGEWPNRIFRGDPARLAGCAGGVATDLEACEHGLVVVVAVVVVVVFFVLRETC